YGPNGVVFEMPDDIPYVHGAIFTSPEAKEKLRHLGIFSVSNGSDALTEWIEFHDPYPVSKVHSIGIEDFYLSKEWARNPPSLEQILERAKKFPLTPHPWLEQHFPALQKVLLGEQPPPDDGARLINFLIKNSRLTQTDPLGAKVLAVSDQNLILKAVG